MRKITKIRRSIRAISPIIAVLLMIAIAVVASLVVYAWVMGYIGATTNRVGQSVQIQSLGISSTGYLQVYVQNVGTGTVTLDPNTCVYVNNVQETSTTASNTLGSGQTATLNVNFPVTSTSQLTVKVVTESGTYSQVVGSPGQVFATPAPTASATPTPTPTATATPTPTPTATATPTPTPTATATPTPTPTSTPTVSITITSSTAGAGFVTVDGNSITTPDIITTWTPGSTHTIAAISTVAGPTGTQYIYASWSDAGAQSHTYTVPSSAATVTANFQTQYQVTFDASSNVKGDSSVTLVTAGGNAKTGVQLPYTAWYNSSQSVTYNYVSPIASSGAPSTTRYLWSSTSGLSQTLQTNTFTVSAYGTVTATYTAQTFGIDTSNTASSASATSVQVTLTNCAANDVIIVFGSGHGYTVSGVTDNLGTHLTWSSRGSVDQTGHQRVSEYRAVFTAGGTITITVTFGTTDTYISVVALAIKGANTGTPFDTHAGLPYSAYSITTGAPTVTAVSTTNANDMIIAFEGSRSATTETAGTGFPLIQTSVTTAGNGAAEEQVATSALAGATVNFGTSTSNDWSMLVDAVQRGW